jgi:hypothetical protein
VKDDVRVLLGLTTDDLWAVPGTVLIFAGFFFADVRWVGGLLLAAAFFLSIYMLRTVRKYWSRPGLSRTTRVLGIVGNVVVMGLFVALAAGMFLLAVDGMSTVEYVRQFAAQSQPAEPDD